MRLLLVMLCCCLLSAFGGVSTVGFNFQAVSVIAFSEATFKTMLHRDFVIAPEVLAMDKKITVQVRSVESGDVAAFVEGILLAQGVSVVERKGVYYLSPVRVSSSLAVAAASVPVPAVADAVAVPALSRLVSSSRSEGREAVEVPAAAAEIFVPQNRPAEFVAAGLVAAFGPKSAVVSGSSVMLAGSVELVPRLLVLASSLDASANFVDVSVSWVEVASVVRHK